MELKNTIHVVLSMDYLGMILTKRWCPLVTKSGNLADKIGRADAHDQGTEY